MLLATGVYTFLRLLEDHEALPFKTLRQMEIEFCSSLLRERVQSNKHFKFNSITDLLLLSQLIVHSCSLLLFQSFFQSLLSNVVVTGCKEY